MAGISAGNCTLNHIPRNVPIELKVATIEKGKVSAPKTLVKANGGNGTLNLSTWAPDSTRFAYATFEALP
jgi:hypothetical protein